MGRLAKAAASPGGIAVLLPICILATGIATNSGAIGMLLGGAAGSALDPLVIIVSVIAGLLIQRGWVAVLVALAMSVAFQAMTFFDPIGAETDSWGMADMVLARALAMVVLIGAAYAIGSVVRRADRRSGHACL